MLEYLFLLCIFSKFIFATLSLPENPYSGDPCQNYLYEQGCYQFASEHSSKYENHSVQSKIFHAFYVECLTIIWLRCEVMNAKSLTLSQTPYVPFKVGSVLTRDVYGNPSKRAHKSGLVSEKLLEPGNRWLIFWDPSKPNTDIEKFNKIKFASIKDLYNIHLKNLTSSVKKFQNAGVEESLDKLCIVKRLPNGKQHPLMDFKAFKAAFEESLEMIKVLGLSPKLANGNYDDLKHYLKKYLPTNSIRVGLFAKLCLEERIHFFHPLFTAIKPGFPVSIHYMPSGMKPTFNPYQHWYMSFVAALFDERGYFVNDPKNGFTSYLVVYFNATKS